MFFWNEIFQWLEYVTTLKNYISAETLLKPSMHTEYSNARIFSCLKRKV